MSSDEQNIKQCLSVLFSTALGERIMLATYGTSLRMNVFDALTTTVANDIRSQLCKTILDWEPRIDVLSIDITDHPETATLVVDVDFVIRQTNSRSNLVYPFYKSEATLASAPL